ncbi:MAG TPA: YhcH/YjgK/YiaL family protein, partial [Abditibacteriaceae bacterium]|nr:YhcH/YjgK/YiaL family protein [Abditibacteriaceae bacterium]
MVVAHLENTERYHTLHPAFAEALAFLKQHADSDLEPGRHEVDGERIYVMAVRGNGHGRAGIVMEAHRKYIDIHLTLGGLEEIGWKPRAHCTQRQAEYDAEDDCELFD